MLPRCGYMLGLRMGLMCGYFLPRRIIALTSFAVPVQASESLLPSQCTAAKFILSQSTEAVVLEELHPAVSVMHAKIIIIFVLSMAYKYQINIEKTSEMCL